jgi:hypothetical protein
MRALSLLSAYPSHRVCGCVHSYGPYPLCSHNKTLGTSFKARLSQISLSCSSLPAYGSGSQNHSGSVLRGPCPRPNTGLASAAMLGDTIKCITESTQIPPPNPPRPPSVSCPTELKVRRQLTMQRKQPWTERGQSSGSPAVSQFPHL